MRAEADGWPPLPHSAATVTACRPASAPVTHTGGGGASSQAGPSEATGQAKQRQRGRRTSAKGQVPLPVLPRPLGPSVVSVRGKGLAPGWVYRCRGGRAVRHRPVEAGLTHCGRFMGSPASAYTLRMEEAAAPLRASLSEIRLTSAKPREHGSQVTGGHEYLGPLT